LFSNLEGKYVVNTHIYFFIKEKKMKMENDILKWCKTNAHSQHESIISQDLDILAASNYNKDDGPLTWQFLSNLCTASPTALSRILPYISAEITNLLESKELSMPVLMAIHNSIHGDRSSALALLQWPEIIRAILKVDKHLDLDNEEEDDLSIELVYVPLSF
jgi:hypothetical protein